MIHGSIRKSGYWRRCSEGHRCLANPSGLCPDSNTKLNLLFSLCANILYASHCDYVWLPIDHACKDRFYILWSTLIMTTIIWHILLHQISATTYPNPEKNQIKPRKNQPNNPIQKNQTLLSNPYENQKSCCGNLSFQYPVCKLNCIIREAP